MGFCCLLFESHFQILNVFRLFISIFGEMIKADVDFAMPFLRSLVVVIFWMDFSSQLSVNHLIFENCTSLDIKKNDPFAKQPWFHWSYTAVLYVSSPRLNGLLHLSHAVVCHFTFRTQRWVRVCILSGRKESLIHSVICEILLKASRMAFNNHNNKQNKCRKK